MARRRRSAALEVSEARELLDESEADVLAFMVFPKAHRTKIALTNPLERLNAEIKRRTNVVGTARGASRSANGRDLHEPLARLLHS